MLDAYQGFQSPETFGSEFNAQTFLIQSILSGVHTCTLVKVISCTNSGGLTPVGTVNVQPLVNQVDGAGNKTDHAVIYSCPYFRLQGGVNAVIIDPGPGDIGIMVFADRDISTVITTKAQANPGSNSRCSMSDGLYIGGALNGTPNQFVQFTSAGITVTTPGTFTVNAAAITLNGPVTATSTIVADTSVTAPLVTGSTNVTFGGKSGIGHTHGGVQPGSGNTGAPS
jgi:hypothetical protein